MPMVGLKGLETQIYKVSVFSSTAGHGPCQNLLDKTSFSTVPDKDLPTCPLGFVLFNCIWRI